MKLKPTIRIGKKKIGQGSPCFIIAEAGINHNNDLDIAKEMIRVAKKAGVDAIKFQTFRASRLYTIKAGGYKYIKEKESIYDVAKRYEIPFWWIPILKEYAERKGLIFFSTVSDELSANKIDKYVPCYKVASYSITHIPLLKHLARKGKPMIISTGCANLADIDIAVRTVESLGNEQLAIMHCVGQYPAKLSSVNLAVIPSLKSCFGIPVGFSDHTVHPTKVPEAAVALGADLIEKHFTLSKSMEGPDHAFSLEPHELKEMVKAIRNTERRMKRGESIEIPSFLLGSSRKHTLKEEEYLRTYAYRCLFAIKDIKRGERFTKRNMAVLRPGGYKRGLEPIFYEILLRKRARAVREIPKGEPITWEDILFVES